MDYRTLLKSQLEQRKLLNPRFSLRSLAKKIELSPSKLSEIIRGKKSLSRERAVVIADKLGLRGLEHEIFILSTEAEESAEIRDRIRTLLTERQTRKTEQRNAWYFGAVKAIQDKGLDPHDYKEALGLTPLQIENAQRFLKRIKKYHPDRNQLSYDSSSLLLRLQDDILSSSEEQTAEFMFLDETGAQNLKKEMQEVLRKHTLKVSKKKNQKLHWVYISQFSLTRNE